MHRIRGPLLAAALLATAASANADYTTEDGKTNVGAVGFLDVTNIDQSSDGKDSAAKGTGIDVKRFYINIEHSFDATWSAMVTTDFNYVSNDPTKIGYTGETQVFIKRAYIQAKVSDAFVARLGSASLPWVPFVEDLYGYRYVEKLIVDRLNFGTTTDWGAHVGGKVNDGFASYAVSAINGGGYKNPTRTKSVDFEGRVALQPLSGLTFAIGAYNGKLGKEVTNGPRTFHSAERFNAVVGYVNPMFRIGVEYFTANDWTAVLKAASDKADGVSAWASVNPTETVSVIARYDTSKPSKDLAPSLKDTYYNVGVACHVRKGIDAALVYKNEKVDHGSISTANGTIGGVREGKYSEIGIWTLVNF
jgi:hypothetical protein